MTRFIYIPLLLLLVFLGACVDDELLEDTTTNQPPSQEIIHTSVYGRILDENGQTLPSATVTLMTQQGPSTTVTDQSGRFEFLNYDNPGQSAYLTVDVPNYFPGYRRLGVLKDNFNYTEVQLLPRARSGTIQSAQGGTVRTSEGMQVDFQPTSIVDANGNAYTGQVNVFMAYLDPTDSDLAARMIGDLSGRAADGRSVSLTTYGMVHVELESSSGAPLNINENRPATLTYPIPEELQSRAPSAIPLWFYGEEEGTWIEDGSARREGNVYVGEVTHFSAWNVDFKDDPIQVSGCVDISTAQRLDTTGTGGARLQVFVCSDLIGRKGGWLTPDGKFLFFNFPKGQAFTIKILDECGNEIYSMDYGPLDGDTDLGVITIANSILGSARIYGQVYNCDDEPVTEGHIQIIAGDANYFAPVTNGSYEYVLQFCDGSQSESIEIISVDYEELLESDPINLTLNRDDEIEQNITACDEVVEVFFKIESDGRFSEVTLIEPGSFILDSFLLLIFNLNDSTSQLNGFQDLLLHTEPVNAIGTYQVQEFRAGWISDDLSNLLTPSDSPLSMEITSYSDISGELIKGTISGEANWFIGQTPNGTIPFEASFSQRVP